MFEWLMIGLLFAIVTGWFRLQSRKPCSGCEGCSKAGCNLKNFVLEVSQDEKNHPGSH